MHWAAMTTPPCLYARVLAGAEFTELRYDFLSRPPYLPDIAPSEFHPFPRLKILLTGRRFFSNEELIRGIDEYLQAWIHTQIYIHKLIYNWFQESAILSPTNEQIDEIHDFILSITQLTQ